MKRIIYIIVFIVALAGCSERLPVGSTVDSCVYLLNSGEVTLSIDSNTEFIDVWVCKGGLDDKRYEVNFVSDPEDLVKYSALTHKSYTPLPGNSYEYSSPKVVLDGSTIKGAARIAIDPLCIPSGVTFILPVRISCSNPSAIREGAEIEYILIHKNK